MYFEKGKDGSGEEPPLPIFGFVPTNQKLVREGNKIICMYIYIYIYIYIYMLYFISIF